MWASAGGRGPLSCCCGWALRSSASGLLGNEGFPGQGLNLCFLRWQADSDPWCARKPLGLAASQGQTRGVRHIHTAAQPLPEPSHLPSPRLCAIQPEALTPTRLFCPCEATAPATSWGHAAFVLLCLAHVSGHQGVKVHLSHSRCRGFLSKP